jgi:ABC-type sugar transport system ATPase subunit
VYDEPATVAVARFVGERPMNLFNHEGIILGIRPERIRIAADGSLPGRITQRESTGADAYIDVETERGALAVRVSPHDTLHAGDPTALELPSQWLRRFDPVTGRAIA